MGQYSRELSDRFSNKGAPTGYCAICRDFGPLTRDHVPPKNCGNFRDSFIREVFPREETKSCRSILSQGGSHFRTLCSRCNSTLLGTEYDPSLSDVVKQIDGFFKSVLESHLALPSSYLFDYKPNRFIRSVFGHLLAANAVGEIVKDDSVSKTAPLDTVLRNFVQNQNSSLPDNIDVYYWLYPYHRRVIMKHSYMGWLGESGQVIYGHVFKFFPFGFWIVQNENTNQNYSINLPKINGDLSCDIDSCRRLLVSFSPLQKPGFPETPHDNGMWLVSDQLASQAVDRNL